MSPYAVSQKWPLAVFPRDLSGPICSTAHMHDEPVSKVPLWHGYYLTFHHFGLILSAVFGVVAMVVSFYLILRHASHYLKPYEQKQIIRILVMIPIYALVSFLSYLYYHNALYFEIMRDCYEAFAISSFFTLMCHYIAPNLHDQKEYFRNIEPRNWVWPLDWMQKCTGGEDKGWLRKPRSGLTWFNVIWISVFQYCFIRPFLTVVAVISQTQGVYCQSDMDPRFAYVWVAGLNALSATIAMYCLIQFYVQLKKDLAPNRPFLKISSIKLVVFFCFWQSWLISLLTAEGGPIKASEKISTPDWRIGVPSMLVCVEMAIFAILHLWAFPWAPYDLKRRDPSKYRPHEQARYAHGVFRALLSALNPWDIVKAIGRGTRWLVIGARKRTSDPSYQSKFETSEASSYRAGRFNHNSSDENVATELPMVVTGKGGSADSDTATLLSNAQANPYVSQDAGQAQLYGSSARTGGDGFSYPPSPQYDEHGLNVHSTGRPFETQATSYGAGKSPPPAPGYQDRRPSANADWDMFAGATRPEDRANRQPPDRVDQFT